MLRLSVARAPSSDSATQGAWPPSPILPSVLPRAPLYPFSFTSLLRPPWVAGGVQAQGQPAQVGIFNWWLGEKGWGTGGLRGLWGVVTPRQTPAQCWASRVPPKLTWGSRDTVSSSSNAADALLHSSRAAAETSGSSFASSRRSPNPKLDCLATLRLWLLFLSLDLGLVCCFHLNYSFPNLSFSHQPAPESDVPSSRKPSLISTLGACRQPGMGPSHPRAPWLVKGRATASLLGLAELHVNEDSVPCHPPHLIPTA